ncbi:MAG TPA: maleylpyruvate isomerase family mycothiol-dependent enzyme [Pseudonocardiaceae bacterium]
MTHHADRARRGIEAAAQATELLSAVVERLGDADMRAPSLLPGWSRAHVITHLARNADGLVNLLSWARTGVEHPMYTSREDRDAAIAAGALRGRLLLAEDLTAATRRFAVAAAGVPDSAWSACLTDGRRRPLPAARVPWLRTREVWLHVVDLDAGVGFGDLPAALHAELLDDVVGEFRGRADVPAVCVRAELPDGTVRTYPLGGAAGGTSDGTARETEDDAAPELPEDAPEAPEDDTQDPPDGAVRGPSADVLAWLTGRSPGTGLRGRVPVLPRWS